MIGIFGGSGFYSLLDNAETVEKDTPFGPPSSPITLGTIGRQEVAFIARHGLHHEYPPHRIPYKANLYAFRELGVSRVIAPAAVGSLKKEIKPGDFVIPDQFVNFSSREDTFFNEVPVTHVSAADPYCPELRKLMIEMAKPLQLPVHETGTVVVVNGPRFASRAESALYQSNGWDIINMTQYPELILAREMEMCYASVCLVTDYDVGVDGGKPVSAQDVAEMFKQNSEKLKRLILDCIPSVPAARECNCKRALDNARFQ
ncbi:MAG: S-methyl-5'-thioadenosine phosphorylase [Candidatus Aenigmarchaeota archaeon]|nr:S-methyl-5'-thioadenosine phosphorylase [Candidatus Aenigmarchaeota archaeon]